MYDLPQFQKKIGKTLDSPLYFRICVYIDFDLSHTYLIYNYGNIFYFI